jgi:2-methylcitrate dehydratase PrpD
MTSDKTSRESKKELVTRWIAEQITSIKFEEHPEEVKSKVRQAVLEALGNALLGRETPLGQSYLNSMWEDPVGFVVIGGERAPPTDAGFTNGGLINALDWDDTARGGGHPSSSLFPAALVVAEEENASIPELLNALVLGYEVSERVATALQPTWERYDVVHGSGTRHTIGAAAAAAALRTSSRTEAQRIIGIAGQLAPVPHAANFGWSEERLTWLKDNNARAVTAAVRAARFPDQFASPLNLLDGETGFWRMAGSDQCNWEVLGLPLSDPCLIDTLEFKPYPCCRWLHSTVEATIQATQDVNTVESVHVETTERVATRFMLDPTNQVNAQFSLPFVVKQAASDRDLHEWYSDKGPAEEPMIEVTASISDDHTERFETDRVVASTVTVDDGTRRSTETIEQPIGSQSRPLPIERTREKLRAGCNQVFGCKSRADQIESVLESDEGVSKLVHLVTNGEG